ncbi:MAG: hypothetical protein M4D85_00245 [Actinomycetota bacterium]|nr:hypothetical protein [Actinomycetota bacterium]
MFVQVIRGRVSDPAGMRRRIDGWHRDLAPGADGWLGTTGGATEDGEFVAVVRFDSEEAARRNSDRPEQGRWWEETERLLDGTGTFRDYTSAETFLDGGSDDAGFVQVIQGHSTDIDRMVAAEQDLSGLLREHRPDLIGGTLGWTQNGDFTETAYFTSEAEAREGERRLEQGPDDLQAAFREWMGMIEQVEYLDLADPWLFSR